MKGSNTISVNQATIVEIVQFYVDAKLVEMGKVKTIKAERDTSYGGSSFTIEFEVVAEEES